MTDAPITVPVSAERRVPWASWSVALVLSAGVLFVLAGLITPWADVRVDRTAASPELQVAIDRAIDEEYGSENPLGLTLDDGVLVIVLVAAYIAVLGLHHRRGRRGRGLPIGALAIAALLTLVGAGNVGDIADTSDGLGGALPVTIDAAIGLYLTIAGGVLTIVAAAVAIAKAAPKQPASVA